MLDAFIDGADRLTDYGVEGIVTTGRRLAARHCSLLKHCRIPVASSSLLQIPMVRSIMPRGRDVGVITPDARSLTESCFTGLGLQCDMPVAGLPEDEEGQQGKQVQIRGADFRKQEARVLKAAGELMRSGKKIGGIVMECASLSPFSASIQGKYNVPVFDNVTLVHWLYNGLKACGSYEHVRQH